MKAQRKVHWTSIEMDPQIRQPTLGYSICTQWTRFPEYLNGIWSCWQFSVFFRISIDSKLRRKLSIWSYSFEFERKQKINSPGVVFPIFANKFLLIQSDIQKWLSESCQIKPYLDFDRTFPIYLTPNSILFCAKSIGKL